jgi:hypothetical protein
MDAFLFGDGRPVTGKGFGKPELRYEIPPGAKPSRCKGCGGVVYWVKTEKGKDMIVDVDGVPHWGACRARDDFKPGRRGQLQLDV